MARTTLLGDLLSGLLDRRRSALDDRSLEELCTALLSTQGQVSGRKIAGAILSRYGDLSDEGKLAFFTHLNRALDLDPEEVARLAQRYGDSGDTGDFLALSRAAEPPRQELFRRLNQAEGATAKLVAMRADLLRLLKSHSALKRTDADLAHLLRSWFNRGFLVLRQINWSSPANVLEKIVEYEAVHEIEDWDDLRRRLHPEDRRCFAFFHPAMPEEPLIFVEVALTLAIPGSIQTLLAEDRAPLLIDDARTAVFYSISNCQKGLAGISFGNLLIKQVAAELLQELPQLSSFVTLSPIPGFLRWLSAEQPEAAAALQAGEDGAAELAATYLKDAKRPDGDPLDPVARFHLGNGAAIHEVHAEADTSDKGRAQSAGVMVNYLYDLSQTEQNHEAFALQQVVTASKSIQAKARAGQSRLKPSDSGK